MTVATTTNKAIATGNGVTTVFPFTFGTLPTADLVVTLFDLLDVEDVQTEGADYTVQGEGDEDGGSVTFTVAPPAGYTVLIQRIVPETQPTDIKNQGSFYPRTIERMFDRIIYIIQQLSERVSAAITLPPQITGVSTQLPAPENNTLFGWNDDSTAITNFPLSSIATSIVYGDKTYQTFVGTGAQVNFGLSSDPASLGNLDISIDGVVQVPVTDFTYSGTILTFSSAPSNGAVILVRYDIAVPVGSSLASAMQFLQAGFSAIFRIGQDKMREVVSPEDFGATGNGLADDTSAVQAALNAGRNVRLTEGKTYVVTSLTISTAGLRLYGRGSLYAKDNVNGQVLRLLANNILVDGIRIDCTGPKPTLNQANDAIRIEGVSGCVVRSCHIDSPKGGGVAVLNSSRNKVIGNTIISAHDNGVLIANLGADDNLVQGNSIIGTTSQNCIFLTADSSSAPTTDYIYRNSVVGNVCANAGDTGIESGQHSRDVVISGNVVSNCVNPEILVRDSQRVNIAGNTVLCGASGIASHDGIAIIEHNETNWDYQSTIIGNVITGKITRGGVYLQGANNVSVKGNKITETSASVNGTTGAGLTGAGVLTAGACYGLDISENDVRRMEYGVFLNLSGAAIAMTDCLVGNNHIVQANIGISIQNIGMVRGRVTGNTINSPVTYGVANNGTSGNGNSRFDNNVINLSGFSGASPVAIQSQGWNALAWIEAGGNDTGWVAVTYQNGWANLAGYAAGAYRKIGGLVTMRGLANNGTASDTTVVCTLPAGFRPPFRQAFKIVNAANPTSDARLEVLANGEVQVLGSVSNTYISFDQISFYVD